MLVREAETESAMSRKSESSDQTHNFAPQDSTPLDITALGKRAAGDENGGTAIEYALIAAGIGAAVAATVFTLGTSTANLYQTVANMF
jgi:pilus assembly protein Flp/PilA